MKTIIVTLDGHLGTGKSKITQLTKFLYHKTLKVGLTKEFLIKKHKILIEISTFIKTRSKNYMMLINHIGTTTTPRS